jgi:hypothetical protein
VSQPEKTARVSWTHDVGAGVVEVSFFLRAKNGTEYRATTLLLKGEEASRFLEEVTRQQIVDGYNKAQDL